MIPPILDKASYGAGAVLLTLLLKFIYKRVRRWLKTRKETARDTAEARQQTATLFTMLVIACAIVFGLLLVLAVTLSPTSVQSPIVRLMAAGVGALGLMGTLFLGFGLPAHKYVTDLVARYQDLESQNSSLDRRNNFLEMRCSILEDRYEKIEETVKELQGQNQDALKGQLPVQRNLAFMEMWAVQKHDLEKAVARRLAGSSR